MRYGLLICLAMLAAPAAAADLKLPKGVTKTASVEGLDEYRLDNGLKVLLFPDYSKPSITVNMVYLAGSLHENYGETGTAHILEHILIRRSRRYPAIREELARRGAVYNAETLYDRTNYFETLPASDENLEFALDLEADRMVNGSLLAGDLDAEKTIIKNELEMVENDPQVILWQRVMSAAHLWHNYGKPEIGALSDILKVPHERLVSFYRDGYRPDNAVLVVAGSFDPAKALTLARRKFGGLRRPASPPRRTHTLEPVQDGERAVALRRTGDTQLVMAGYHTPYYASPDTPAVSVLTAVLGDPSSGRLYNTLVKTGKAASVKSGNLSMREGGMATFTVAVRKGGDLDGAAALALETLERAAEGDFTPAETEAAKAALLKNIDLTLKSGQSLALALTDHIASGDWRLFFINRDRLREVTPADVKRAAARYLKPSNRTLGSFRPADAPDRAEMPVPEDIAALVKDYKGGKAAEPGEFFDLSPENIERRTVRAVLPNGLKLALLPKKTRGGAVTVFAGFHRGTPETLAGKASISDLTKGMLMRGTARRGREEIKAEFDRLKTRANIGGDLSLETDRENLPAALRLAAEVLREPAFAESEFQALKQETLARLEADRMQPESLVWKNYYRYVLPYPPDDIRYTPTAEEKIEGVKAVTLEQVKAYYRDFYGASFAELSAVGDFDPEEFKKLAGELLGDWKTPQPYGRLARLYTQVPAASFSTETPDKANAFMAIGHTLPLQENHPDAPALRLASYMAGEAIDSRFSSRIREKEGLSYNVWSDMTMDPEDPFTLFAGAAIYSPENAERIEKAFREEIDRVIAGGFTEEEVARAKAGWLYSRLLQRASDSRLARILRLNEYLGRDMKWMAGLEAKVRALTPEEVHRAFKRHILPERLIVVKAGDFAAKR